MESMNESRSIRVIIADDQELVRAGFAMVIGSQPDMEVVGQASDGAQAVALAESLHPDVVLMDVRMPGMDGIEATSRITSLSAAPGDATVSAESADDRPTRVIILTTFDLDEYVMAAINAGASGFLLKDTEPETYAGRLRAAWFADRRCRALRCRVRFRRRRLWRCGRQRCRLDDRHPLPCRGRFRRFQYVTPSIHRSRTGSAYRP